MIRAIEIDGWISAITGNRAGHLSEKVRVEASYESAGISNDIAFSLPIESAKLVHVGQKISIVISLG